jgi:hypothetical protein
VSLVIDSSMTLAWYFEDERTQASVAVLNQAADAGAVVPVRGLPCGPGSGVQRRLVLVGKATPVPQRYF